jgi:hypothetical protein
MRASSLFLIRKFPSPRLSDSSEVKIIALVVSSGRSVGRIHRR